MAKKKRRVVDDYFEDAGVKAIRAVDPKSKVKSKHRIDPPRSPKGSQQALEEIVRLRLKGKEVPLSQLDEYVYKNARQNVPYSEIASRLGITVEEVHQIYQQALQREHPHTSAEMKLVLVDQLQAIQNRLWALADAGDPSSFGIMLQCVKELSRLYELVSTKTNIEINIIEQQQATVVINVVSAAFEYLMQQPEIRKAISDTRANEILAEALEVASAEVEAAQERVVTVDDKGVVV